MILELKSLRPLLAKTLLATTALCAVGTQSAIAQECTVTGGGTIVQCDNAFVVITPTSGEVIATVDSVNTGGLDFYPSAGSSDSLNATLNIVGSTEIYRAAYPAIAWMTTRDNVNLAVNVGSDVIVRSDQYFGAIWLRTEGSGELSINSAATVTATGAAQDGITLTSSGGNVSLTNTGTVVSELARGLYADANNSDPIIAHILNSGSVTSALAGARAINYNGLASITNTGSVETKFRQGLVAWSADGPSSIINSGTITALDDIAVTAWTETGNASITNSGIAVSQNDTTITDQGIGHHGLHARVNVAGNIAIENEALGEIDAAEYGIWAETAAGDVSVIQSGSVTAAQGIIASSADGSVSVANSGTISALARGVSLQGTTNSLVNTGTITANSVDGATITTGNGDSIIRNSGTISNTGNDIAIKFGNGTNRLILDTQRSLIDGQVLAGTGVDYLVLETGSSSTISLVSVGDSGQFRNFDFIEKTGLGVLNFTGDATGFSGTTLVKDGKLAVNGNNGTSAVTVFAGATLSGSGTVGTTVLQSGATITPGNSIGTLNVVGDYTQQSGSLYTVELEPTSFNSDKVLVSGTATLEPGAILSWSKWGSGTFALDAQYTILTATGGLTGTYQFTGSPVVSAFYDLVPTYDTQNAYLTVTQTRTLDQAAITPNQIATAIALDGLAANNPLRSSVSMVDNMEQARIAFDAFSGEAYASIHSQILDHGRVLGGIALDRLSEDGHGLWAVARGSRLSVSANSNAAAFSADNLDIVGGIDNTWNDWRLGIMLHGGAQDFTSDRAMSASLDSFGIGGYGSKDIGNTGISFGVDFSWLGIDASRDVDFASISDHLGSDYDGLSGTAFARLSHTFELSTLKLIPYGDAAFVYAHTNSFSETGGQAALAVKSSTSQAIITTLGVDLQRELALKEGSALALNVGAGWQHVSADTPTTTNAFAGGESFTVSGVPLPEDAFVVEAGVSWTGKSGSNFGLSYDGSLSGSGESHALKASFSKSF